MNVIPQNSAAGMSESEAVALVTRLKGMFPTMTDVQVREAHARLIRCDHAIGKLAVERMVCVCQEFIFERLLTFLSLETERVIASPRQRQLDEDSRQARQAQKRWRDIGEFIQQMPAEEFDPLAEQVLSGVDEVMAKRIRGYGVRNSKLVQGGVAQLCGMEV